MTRRSQVRSRRLGGTSGEGSVPPVAIVLLVLIAVLVGATLYLYLELRSAKTEMAEQFQIYDEKLASLEGSVNRTSREVGSQVAQVKGMVATAEKEIANAAVQVEQRVLGRTANLEKELAASKEQQEAALLAVDGQINQLNEAATTASTRVGALSGEVETVRTDLTAAQEEIRQTIADLKSVRGDLGVQSGLVATNGSELLALKQLGQRNYYEFDIQKSRQSQRVGRIQIRLRSTNDKRGRFTIDVTADDKEIQKKNKTLLEPIQFYVIGSKVPYEIVVNQLEKNRIVGYLATPLDDGSRAPAAAE